jgi:23S rRNA (cytosine1962-C5)-methyltransferase
MGSWHLLPVMRNDRLRLLERRGAAPDHPVVLNIPETEYLKCLILQVE